MSSRGEVLQVCVDEFEKRVGESMFLLTLHPQVIGHRSRIMIPEKLVEHMKKHKRVWFATCRAAAEYIRDPAKLTRER
ncbi:MAG: hypothetical protein FJ215_10435 [Ignavibacteria bacterium]|nr:hypothetical protein [Ignavibacteria bacterium]